MSMTPILFLGAGRMGAAIASGLVAAGALRCDELILLEPHPGPEVLDLERRGARLNPERAVLATARTVVLAVKPQLWRGVAEACVTDLAADARVISIAAGVRTAALVKAFGGRRVARVMPTTAVSVAKGVASVWAADASDRASARALFAPLAHVVDLPDEGLMDAATAVSGSGPAYVYALVEAMAGAGIAAGLAPDAAAELARATVIGAAALMERSDESPEALRIQVTSPGGTTAAALSVLQGEAGLRPLMTAAVAAAVARAKELG
jgi:pyrroline-5-carboxylate reductase